MADSNPTRDYLLSVEDLVMTQAERIVALEATLRALVAVPPIAEFQVTDYDPAVAEFCIYCWTMQPLHWEEEGTIHTPDCPREMARELLKGEGDGP